MNKQMLEQIRARAEAARRMGFGFQGFRYGKQAFQNLVYQDIPALLTHIDELKHENDVMYQELCKQRIRDSWVGKAMDKERLDEIGARVEEATRCLWIVPEVVPMTGEMPLADFVAYSRQDIPDLLAHVKKLENELKEALKAAEAEAEPPTQLLEACKKAKFLIEEGDDMFEGSMEAAVYAQKTLMLLEAAIAAAEGNDND